MLLADNLKIVHSNIEAACKLSGRNPSEVTLIAVSKTKPLEAMNQCYALGERHFGENYVQEMMNKQTESAAQKILPDAKWHMIGHLQTNKVRFVVGNTALIHSVDSLHLLQAIERDSKKKAIITDVLLEVNVAQEESKWGFSVEEIRSSIFDLVFQHPHVNIRGLMTSAPYTMEANDNRLYFRELRELRDECRVTLVKSNQTEKAAIFQELSMGMTGDYVVAIEEGATMVRVGTGIFGERKYQL
ncbi:MAG: YggS family pyridoxal phosphate-dependent enzyme [Lachnospiraceae bacterium]|nr:YggS family pyridoxal phosphate-dependent enzyme [Lachnospiraceae bacterium]